ncbi:MAG: helix-turn-helix transcriptional regulator [Erysipelotrichaceae bacterium]|nr:helix-turn-helix transcriptional regulator [Erysipelotrichaceae bacterium]
MNKRYSDLLTDRILAIMQRKEITQTELAKHVGMNKTTLGRYLRKERSLPFDIGAAIAKELNIDLNRIIGIGDQPIDEKDYAIYLKFKELIEQALQKES